MPPAARLAALLLLVGLCSNVRGGKALSEPGNAAEPHTKLASSEFKKFLQLSSAFIKSGQKAGAELPQEHQAVSGSMLK